MVTAVTNYLGAYVQLAGDGLASLNWPWLVSACILILGIWFIFKVILKIFDMLTGRK